MNFHFEGRKSFTLPPSTMLVPFGPGLFSDLPCRPFDSLQPYFVLLHPKTGDVSGEFPTPFPSEADVRPVLSWSSQRIAGLTPSEVIRGWSRLLLVTRLLVAFHFFPTPFNLGKSRWPFYSVFAFSAILPRFRLPLTLATELGQHRRAFAILTPVSRCQRSYFFFLFFYPPTREPATQHRV